MQRRIKRFAAVLGMAVALGNIAVAGAASATLSSSRVAYVSSGDVAWGNGFRGIAGQTGAQVTFIRLPKAASYDYSNFDLVVVADDTAPDCWAGWGTQAAWSAIANSGTPVLGIGQGGSCFFENTDPELGWMGSMYLSSDSADLTIGGGNAALQDSLLLPSGL